MAQNKTTGEYEQAGIREKYNPSQKEKDIIEFIYKRYLAMKSSKDRTDAELEWKKGIRAWEAAREPKLPDDWQSNHYVPLTTSIVESALSEVIDQSPQPLILPRGGEDASKSTVMQHIFEYSWEVGDGDLALYDVVKDAFIYGTGIAQEYYFQDIRYSYSDTGKTKSYYAYDDVYMEPVKLEDFFIDETARGFTGPYAARDCIRRFIMNIEDYKAFFQGEVWDKLGNAKYVEPGGDTNYYEWYRPPQGIDTSKQVEVLWYWQVKPKSWLCIIANDVLQLEGDNPYKHKELPFARAIDIKRPNKFYGKGEPALLESIQDEMNTFRRMVIDRNHLDIDKMFFVSSRLNLSDEDTIARPHGTIPVDDINAAKPIEYGDVPVSVELSQKHLEDDATIVTGINPRAQSLPTAGTATEAAILKESTLKRIRLKVRRLEKEFLTRIGRLRVANILQYYPQTKMEAIIGEKETSEFGADGVLGISSKKYQKIPIPGKEINFDVNGNMVETPSTGITFFELRPEYFTPVAEGGFDIKFAAGSTIPISKPLMQSKATEMYDRLIQLAAVGIGYDPVKLGDLLLKVNDYNPNDFHLEKTQGASNVDAMAQTLINLANFENRLIMGGKDVPPTPYSSPAHTQIHVAFTASPSFQGINRNDPKIKVMTAHIMGELQAQEARGGQGTIQETPASGGQPSGNLPPRPQTMVNANAPTRTLGGSPDMTNIMGALIQGGGQALG